MKISKYITKTLSVVSLSLLVSASAVAGNEKRAGQAGAGELLINPWANSSGWGLASAAGISGVEASHLNVAGLARLKSNLEIGGSYTSWWSDIAIYNAGFAMRMDETSVLGISIMHMNFGDILITTEDNPGDGVNSILGTYSPGTTVIGVQYAKNFTPSISGGVNIKVVNEATPEMEAMGMAIDVGVQYFTGENDEVKFGIALKNVGTPMSFTGDGDDQGLITSGTIGPDFTQKYEYRESSFELPTQMIISGSYDFILDERNTITPAMTFVSNSFSKDQIGFGAEYSYKDMFKIHTGYDYQSDLMSSYDEGRTTALTGFAIGAEISFPYGIKKDKDISIAYSYRTANPLDSPNTIGIKMKL